MTTLSNIIMEFMIITLFHRCNERLCNILGIFTRFCLFVLVNVSTSSLCELLKEKCRRIWLLAECLPNTRSHLNLLLHFHDRVHPTDGLAHLRTAHRVLHKFFRTATSNLPKVIFNAKSERYVITYETESVLKVHILEKFMGCLRIQG